MKREIYFLVKEFRSDLQEPQDNMSRSCEMTVFVGGTSSKTSIQDIKDFFYNYAYFIKSVKIFQGFAFVSFKSAVEADRAIYELNKKYLKGKSVTVERKQYKDIENLRYTTSSRTSSPSAMDFVSPDEEEATYVFRLKVSNLSETVTWRVLKDFMQQAGHVLYADSHRYVRHFGVVHFTKRRDMLKALAKLDGKILHKRRIRLHSPKMIKSRYSFKYNQRKEPSSIDRRFSRTSFDEFPPEYFSGQGSSSYSCWQSDMSFDRTDEHRYRNEYYMGEQELIPMKMSRFGRSLTPEESVYPREVHYPPKELERPSRSRVSSSFMSSYRSDPRRYERRSSSPPQKRLKSDYLRHAKSRRKFSPASARRESECNVNRKYDTYLSMSGYDRPTVESVIVKREELTSRQERSVPTGPRTPSYTPPRELAPIPYNAALSSKPLGNALASSSPAGKRKSRRDSLPKSSKKRYSSDCSCDECWSKDSEMKERNDRPISSLPKKESTSSSDRQESSSPSSSTSSSSTTTTVSENVSSSKSAEEPTPTNLILHLAVENNSLVQEKPKEKESDETKN